MRRSSVKNPVIFIFIFPLYISSVRSVRFQINNFKLFHRSVFASKPLGTVLILAFVSLCIAKARIRGLIRRSGAFLVSQRFSLGALGAVAFPASLPVVDHKFTPEGNGEQFVPPRNRHERRRRRRRALSS